MDVDALLRWYDGGHRDLPWRRTRDPYALLVSEVMLQQTQAARVVPFYERFLARFPTAGALAAAPAADVLAHWSGLGYNRRALALQRAAAHVAEHGWPEGAEGLRALPGVGPYTAAAVASFAYGEPVAAVDTNVRRVLERHDAVRRPPADLAARAAELLPRPRAAAFNQAMMELGATVCTPRRPGCGACPVRRSCAGGEASPPPRPARGVRFEDSDRFLRGRVVAAALAGEGMPVAEPERLARVVDGLVRDGLVARGPGGEVRAP
jgi:A/G-specific adenine glycosylase